MEKRSKRAAVRVTKDTAIVLAVILAALLVWYFIDGQTGGQVPAGECEITMIDVGQGDAFLLRSGDKTVLIDTGPVSGREKLDAFLAGAGVGRIDCMILTHPHEDHIGNAHYIIKNYTVARVMMPDATTNTYCFEKLLRAADNAGLEIEVPETGDVYEIGEMKFTVLFAPSEVPEDDLNLYSPIIRLDFGGVSALFTGDAEKWNEAEAIKRARPLLDCDILKVAHHGSDTSNSEEFIAAVSPAVGLISCEKGNEYGHPHAKALKTFKKYGVTLYRTDRESTVTVVIDGDGFRKVDKKAG